MARTTVQVSDLTKQMLDLIKQKGQTYDELISELVRLYRGIPRSMAGAFPDLNLPPSAPATRPRTTSKLQPEPRRATTGRKSAEGPSAARGQPHEPR